MPDSPKDIHKESNQQISLSVTIELTRFGARIYLFETETASPPSVLVQIGN